MFTFPFLHTLPIIITKRKASFSDLATLDWLLWVTDWLHPIVRTEERFVVGSVWLPAANMKQNLIANWSSDIWGPRFAHLSVLLKCAPAHTTWTPSETLPLVRAAASAIAIWWRGKVYGKRLRLRGSGKNGPGAGCRGERKHGDPAARGERRRGDCGQNAVRCWRELEMREDWWKKLWRSSQSQGCVLKAPGRSGLGWLSTRKREQPTMDRESMTVIKTWSLFLRLELNVQT